MKSTPVIALFNAMVLIALLVPRGAARELEGITFKDVAERSGIAFTLANSATGQKHIVEPMTGGVAVLDYDNDGRLDIYFVNGARLPSLAKDDPAFENK